MLSRITIMISNFISILETKLKDRHLNELLRGSAVAFALRMFGMGAAYLFTLLITRNFGAKAMGIFALCFTVLQISSVVGRLGLDTALLRFVAEHSSQNRKDLVKEVYTKAMKMVVPFGLFLSVLLFFLSPYIAKYVFHKEYLSPYFRIVSVAVLPMVLVFVNSESLRGLKRIKDYIFLQNVAINLFAAVILAVALFFLRNIYVPLIAYTGSLFLVALISVAMWHKHSGLNMVAHKSNIKLRDILNVSLPMMLASSLFFIMHWTDTIMLGMFRTEGEVGVYNVAMKIAMLTSVTLFAINSIAAPKFAEFHGRGDMKGLGRVAQQSTKLIFWSSFPILLVIFLVPSFILGIFGEEFRFGVYALLILAFGQFINSISGSVGYILQMTGKQKVFQNIIIGSTIINILLNTILIPRYGINGAALASATSIMFWNLSSIIYIKYSLGFFTVYMPYRSTLKARY
jgi:O-antigen/teichoic acid export membrane protein